MAEYGSNVSFWITWAALIGYAALFSPNQTPLRDQYFLEKILGLGVEDGVPINTVFFCLFNIMGVMPGIYASLLLPSGKSANGVRRPAVLAHSPRPPHLSISSDTMG